MTVKELKEMEEKANKLAEKNEKAEAENARLQKELDAAKEKALHAPNVQTQNINSLEQKALRNFGVAHPRQLLEINVGAEKFAHVPVEQKQAVIEMKKAVDTSRWIQQIFHNEPMDRFTASEKNNRVSLVKGTLENYFAKNELVGRLKAFGSTVVGAGDEWVPTAISSNYIEEFELEKKVGSLFKDLPMPSNPFELPIQLNKTVARKATENTSHSSNNFNTDALTFNAVKLQEFYLLPEELLEDSAPDFMAIGRNEVVQAIHRAKETAIINGDSDGTHQDSDTDSGAADLAEKIWDGLRKAAIGNSANGATPAAAAALSDTFLRNMRKLMGKFGVNVRDLAWIVSPIGYQQMLGLDDVTTVEKFGPQATVLQGALAAYQGIPIIISEYLRDDLNASGVFDNTTVDNTGILLVNKSRFFSGLRRPIRMKVMQDLLDQDRMQIAAYSRMAFTHFDQSATEKSVIYGVDVTA